MLKFIAKEGSELCAKYIERGRERESNERGGKREKSFQSEMMRKFYAPPNWPLKAPIIPNDSYNHDPF